VEPAALVPHDRHRDHRGRLYGRPVSESLRDHGLRIGDLDAGPRNTITDVPGVSSARPRSARRAGGRAHRRHRHPAQGRRRASRAPGSRGDGGAERRGELTGSIQIREWGILETPVYLTRRTRGPGDGRRR
jgi:L-aminopeptidase/D-esterase-like protein